MSNQILNAISWKQIKMYYDHLLRCPTSLDKGEGGSYSYLSIYPFSLPLRYGVGAPKNFRLLHVHIIDEGSSFVCQIMMPRCPTLVQCAIFIFNFHDYMSQYNGPFLPILLNFSAIFQFILKTDNTLYF